MKITVDSDILNDMNDDIYFSSDRQTSSWIIDDRTCWIQTTHQKISERINDWSFTRKVAEGFNCPLWIYSIPRRKWRWVLRSLGLRIPDKNTQRRMTGFKIGSKNLEKGLRAQVKKI